MLLDDQQGQLNTNKPNPSGYRDLAYLVVFFFVGVLIEALLMQSLLPLFGIASVNDLIEQLQLIATGEREDLRNPLLLLILNKHIFYFIFPAFMAAVALSKNRPFLYLNLNIPPRLTTSILALLWLFVSFPFFSWMYTVITDLLPESMIASDEVQNALLKMDTPGQFILTFLLVGVTAGIGEEMFFRGFIQKNFLKISINRQMAIWFAAMVFSLMHFQLQYFFPRLFMGAMLGYIFFWTGSLWTAIIAHMFNNGWQLSLTYLNPETNAGISDSETGMPLWLIGISLMLLIIIGRALYLRRIIPES